MVEDNAVLDHDLCGDATIASALAMRAQWWVDHGAPRYAKRQPHPHDPHPDRPLRIGYVTADLFLHSAALVFGNLIGAHDHSFAQTIVYSMTPAARYDHITAQFVTKFGPNFRDVSHYRPETIAQMIREDGIDILVDLSGYTPGNALRAFAEKPAPVQITGWGYATGLGWPCGVMDALIGDAVAFPPAMRQKMSEQVIDLPCLLAYTIITEMPPPSALPVLRSHTPVFAVFQRTMKVQSANLHLWTNLLQQLPDAILQFKGHAHIPVPEWQRWVRSEMAAVQDRIEFLPITNQGEHFRAFQHVDLSLDPWPQTGGVSTLESLAMGVPMLTLIGERPIQRTTASINHVLKLDDFTVSSEIEYLDRAIAWVTDRTDELAKIRIGLRQRLERSPICRGYARAAEAAYRALWYQWCDRAAESAA